jgi:serine/threonine protein kinase
MADHPQPEISEVVRLAEQIGRGLLAFHRRETTHRDLKPDNVMIDHGGRAVIIDLGSCHIAGIHEIALPIPRDAVLGTARYAAPEARLGFGAHPRCDLFSLATIVYEMLTGVLPYGEAIEAAQTPDEFARLRYTPSYQHNPMVPVWMDAAIRRAVAVEPEARYGELSEFLADLRKPNPRYLREVRAPLIERDPARFWRRMAIALVLLELATLALWGLRAGG